MLTKKIRLFIYKIPWVYTFLAKSWRLVNRGGVARVQVKLQIRNFYKLKKDGRLPLFESVEIETINRCNGTCEFCPVNKHQDVRTYAKMDDDLFYKIIRQLHELQFSGNLSLYSNNEPFLDERIIKFAKEAKKMVPGARLIIFTNGMLLTLDKFKEIITYLDEMVIDNYSDNMAIPKNILEIKAYCKENPEIKSKLTIAMRKQHEVLTTRGGTSPNKQITKTVNLPCTLPFKQFIIRPDGKVSLCCNDALGQMTMGDVARDSLVDIWNSQYYEDIRRKLANGRHQIKICSKCDTILTIK